MQVRSFSRTQEILRSILSDVGDAVIVDQEAVSPGPGCEGRHTPPRASTQRLPSGLTKLELGRGVDLARRRQQRFATATVIPAVDSSRVGCRIIAGLSASLATLQ